MIRSVVVRTLLGFVTLSLAASPQRTPVGHLNPPVVVSVDAASNRHPIDPAIYGSAWAETSDITALGLTLNRWGGNAVSRHNWAISTTNRAKDWYFENIPDAVSEGDGSNGKSADDFVEKTLNGGAQAIITIPMMGMLPKDRTVRWSYSVAKYGPQDSTDAAWHPDAGNGKSGGNRLLHVNDPSDTSEAFPVSHQANWIRHLVATWGAAGAGGVRYYALDNEPTLWSFDHWDVHPDGASYDEVWSKMEEYGAMIRAEDPAALISGIEEWGWSGYFSSGLDLENGNNADRNAHGGVYFAEWLLQKARSYEDTKGQRILDIASLHFYPQSGEFGDDVTTPMQLMRNRSTRSLWDPSYVDESWIGGTGIDGGKVRLIPRLREWTARNYPGTKIGITEYNWGAEGHINGATAQADILGIFGREGLDVGVRWATPLAGSPVANAIRMYRNYDGLGSAFGDLSVAAGGPNPDGIATFAALRSSDRALTIMIVAKNLTDSTPVTVNLANFTPSGNAQRWQLDAGNAIVQLADVVPGGGSLGMTVPAQSITLLVVPGVWIDAPASLTATATSTTAVALSWAPVAGASGYEIFRSSMSGAYSLIGSTAATTFNDGGRAANTTYLYRVRATAGGLASGLGPIDAATTVMFTDDPLVAGTTAKAVHVTELRAAINAMRAAAGLSAATFTDGPAMNGVPIKAIHIAQLRLAADQARATIGISPSTYADRAVTTAITTVKAAHVTQLRNTVK